MRTVSFSNRRLQNELNKHFVNTYTNTTGDPTAGMSINHRPTDRAGSCVRGNGKQNVQTLFLTPEGEIFHAATGFLSSEDLGKEVIYAKRLFEELQRSDNPEEVVTVSHRNRLADSGFSDEVINDRSPLAAMKMIAQQFERPSMPQRSSGFANGSSSRNFGSSDIANNPFAGFSKMQFLEDNKFSIQHPLLTADALERDPTLLVGNGKSFFSSSASQ